MKKISSRLFPLFVIAGLLPCLSLSAQQYHDAAAFGLKGNVKEVKVIHQKTGDLSIDVHGFSELSFGRDGRLERWNRLGDVFSIPDDGREGTLLVHGYHPSEDASADIYFLYDRENFGDRAYGFYRVSHIKYNAFDWYILGLEDEDVYNVSIFFETGNNTIIEDRIVFSIPPTYDAKNLIKENLEFGGGILGMDLIRDDLSQYVSEKGFEVYESKREEFKVSAWDSHGNYTVLDGKDNPEYSIKRVITYWEESPEDSKQISSTSVSAVSYLKVDGAATNKTVSFLSSGGRQYYSVDTSAGDFETWGVPSWCSVEKSPTGFTLVCDPNSSSASRSDYMKVKADGLEIRIDISQSGSTSGYGSQGSRSGSRSRYRSGGGRSFSFSEPWITIGIDGSLDYMISDSETPVTYYDPYYGEYYTDDAEEEGRMAYGAGLRVRIGRIDQMFNLIGGARYMFGDMKGLLVPVLLNWNLLRGESANMYIGGGYEFGITEMYKGTGSAVAQFGIGIPHFDCSFFYKPSQNVLGVGVTIYL